MVYNVSPYLRLPCRDLPTACEQLHVAKGLLDRPCGACSLSDHCKTVMRAEPRSVSQLPQPLKRSIGPVVTSVSHEDSCDQKPRGRGCLPC